MKSTTDVARAFRKHRFFSVVAAFAYHVGVWDERARSQLFPPRPRSK